MIQVLQLACYGVSFETVCLILVCYIWAFHLAWINHVTRQIFPDRTEKETSLEVKNKMPFLVQPTWAKYTLGLSLAPLHFAHCVLSIKERKTILPRLILNIKTFAFMMVISNITFMYTQNGFLIIWPVQCCWAAEMMPGSINRGDCEEIAIQH